MVSNHPTCRINNKYKQHITFSVSYLLLECTTTQHVLTGLDGNEHIHNKHSVTNISATIVHVNYMYQHAHELIHNHEVTAIMDNITKLSPVGCIIVLV